MQIKHFATQTQIPSINYIANKLIYLLYVRTNCVTDMSSARVQQYIYV